MSFLASFFFTVLFLSVCELFLLLRVIAAAGFLPAMLLCLLTGVLGGALIRHQGLATIRRIHSELLSGRLPAGELLQGVILIVAGVFLCVPGFITDAAGFLCLIPPLRRFLVHQLRRWAARSFHFEIYTSGPGWEEDAGEEKPRIIDAEFQEKPSGKDPM